MQTGYRNGTGGGGGGLSSEARSTVLFDQSKAPALTLASGYRQLHRRLKSAWKVEVNTEELSEELSTDIRLLVIAAPQHNYTQHEFENIRRYLAAGGSVLCMMTEGGEAKLNTNLNFLLEEYGMMVNNDAVIRTVFYKYFHPKEALISNGILNRAIATGAGKKFTNTVLDDEDNHAQALAFVYPYGATLNVNRLGTPVLSTGSVCFPIHRPVAALHVEKTLGAGRLALLGSAHMFSDQYLDREDNARILDVIVQFLTDVAFKLNAIDAEDPEISDYHPIPDHVQLSEQIKSCLQEGEGELYTRDLTKLFDASLFAMDLCLLPRVLRAYDQLNIRHEQLALIQPQFEMPLPTLEPAVFPPDFQGLSPPQLEMFDLDEVFSSDKVRLAQLTNKCTSDEDLGYFIREAGDVLGVNKRLPPEQRTAAHVIEFICAQVAEFKKLNQELSGAGEQPLALGGSNAGYNNATFEDEVQFSDVDDDDDDIADYI